MSQALELLWFLLALGLVEAVIKPIAKLWVQRRVLAWAPRILERLDPVLPQWLAECDGTELEERVRQLAQEVTGEDWSHVDLQPLWVLFDPRRCAQRIAQGPIPSAQSGQGSE